jgi:hypothetical protein
VFGKIPIGGRNLAKGSAACDLSQLNIVAQICRVQNQVHFHVERWLCQKAAGAQYARTNPTAASNWKPRPNTMLAICTNKPNN